MYPEETLGEDDDDGTMPENVEELRKAVVGHRIVSVDKGVTATVVDYLWRGKPYRQEHTGTQITLDNGEKVLLVDSGDCCACTELELFLLHYDKVDHIITGVGTTGEYTKWHIYADAGDVLELTVGWSCGNPFYYGYGFDIYVIPIDSEIVPEAIEA